MHDLWSLVISGAPTEKPAIPYRCLKRLGSPEIKRIRWLNVIMTIDDQVRPVVFATSG
jgi:hypothetical protein